MDSGSIPPGVERRLERFTRRLDAIRPEDLFLFGAQPADMDRHDEATLAARSIAIVHASTASMDRAHELVQAWLFRRIGEQQGRPWAIPRVSQTTGSGADYAAIASSLTDAVSAIVMWDLLSESDRDELLGPWARLAV